MPAHADTMMTRCLLVRTSARRWLACALLLLPGLVLAQTSAADAWQRVNADLRIGFETVKLPGNEHMGLVGTSYLAELSPGLCVGPAVYGAVSGQFGGLFTVGGEAAWCTRRTAPLRGVGGLYGGGGGGGGAPVGGGLMLRPHADLLWDFGGYRAGLSVSNVRFPSGQINSTQVGLVFGMNTTFTYLPSGRTAVPFYGSGRTGLGFDRIQGVVGVYRPTAGSEGNSGNPLSSQIGYVGMRAERFYTPNFFGGLEANGAASGGAAGYAEFLGTLGLEWSLFSDTLTLGGRAALGMGGGGDLPTGGGLLAKAALDASLRLSRNLSLTLEGGWAQAPQGTFKAPFGSLALRWDLDHPQGQPTKLTREEFSSGVETYVNAARKTGPPQSLQNVTFKLNRFVSESLYITGQVQSAFAGGAGAFSVGLIGLGAQTHFGDRVVAGAEMLVGAAGGGGVDTSGGAIAKPMVYAGYDFTPSLSARLGAGYVKSMSGPLSSPVADLTLTFSFGVASRP
jgi:hypothetical protein